MTEPREGNAKGRYTPAPGTIVATIVAWLAAHPGWHTAKDIAAAVEGCMPETNAAVLGSPVRHGLVLMRKDRGGRNSYRAATPDEAGLPVCPMPAEAPVQRVGPSWCPLDDPVPLEGPKVAMHPDGTVTVRTLNSATTFDRDTSRAIADYYAELIRDSWEADMERRNDEALAVPRSVRMVVVG